MAGFLIILKGDGHVCLPNFSHTRIHNKLCHITQMSYTASCVTQFLWHFNYALLSIVYPPSREMTLLQSCIHPVSSEIQRKVIFFPKKSFHTCPHSGRRSSGSSIIYLQTYWGVVTPNILPFNQLDAHFGVWSIRSLKPHIPFLVLPSFPLGLRFSQGLRSCTTNSSWVNGSYMCVFPRLCFFFKNQTAKFPRSECFQFCILHKR